MATSSPGAVRPRTVLRLGLTVEAHRLQEERSESWGRKPRLNEVNHEAV